MLSYRKIWLYKALVNSNVPEDPYLSAELNRYFPAPVQRALRRAFEAPSPAPRDHRHGHHQQPDQPHGAGVPGARAGRHRRGPGRDRARLHDRARGVRGARHLGADRRPRQSHTDRRAVHRDVSNHPPAAAHELLAAREPAREPGHRACGAALRRAGERAVERARLRAERKRQRAAERPALAPDASSTCRSSSPRASHRWTRCTARSIWWKRPCRRV